MPTLQEAKEWIESEYNEYITVYDYGDHIRFTNGSAAHYADIRLNEGRFELKGEDYGETVEAECEATEDALLDMLSSNY